jgi:hypothetical protein
MLNLVGLTAIRCEVCFVTRDFAHQTVAQRPEMTKKTVSWTLNQFKCELARMERVTTGLSWPAAGLSSFSVYKLMELHKFKL